MCLEMVQPGVVGTLRFDRSTKAIVTSHDTAWRMRGTPGAPASQSERDGVPLQRETTFGGGNSGGKRSPGQASSRIGRSSITQSCVENVVDFGNSRGSPHSRIEVDAVGPQGQDEIITVGCEPDLGGWTPGEVADLDLPAQQLRTGWAV